MDNFGRYENITVDNGAGLGYVYSNRKLSGIQRKAGGTTTLSYSFGYDAFGNTTQLKAGNKTLAGYTYAPCGKVLTATGTMAETNPCGIAATTTIPKPASTICNPAIMTPPSAAS